MHLVQKLPLHLSGEIALGLIDQEPVAQFEIGTYKNFVYLILDWKDKKAAIVDPQHDLEPLLQAIQQNGFELTYVFLTHTHFDHIAGVPQLVRHYPTVPLVVHRDDLHRIDSQVMSTGKVKLVRDGDLVSVGSLTVQALHTPGHSAGECSYFLKTNPPYLFTGDTIFIRDCGRTDFEDGSNEQMFSSVQRVKRLPAETIILPGHHYKSQCASTVGKEIKESPPFRCKTVAELAALP